MQTSKWLSTIAGAAILACSSLAANATEVVAYYSLNGGALTLAPDAAPSSTALASFFVAGGFSVNLATGTSVPTSAPALLTSNLQNLHTGSTTDNLKVYILSVDNAFPLGNQTLTTTFTQNGGALTPGTISGTLSSYAGASALASPFPATTSLASLDLAQLLGSTSFPPNLANVLINGNAVLAPGFSLAAVYDVTATGTANSNATINIAQVPGPIVGAGLPGLIAACGGLLALARRRRKEQVQS